MGQHMLEIGVENAWAVIVCLGLEDFSAALEAASEDDLLAKVDLGVGILHPAMLLLDMGIVSRVEVEGEIAAASEFASPLGIGGVYLVKMPLEVGFPPNPHADSILGAKGALKLCARGIA